MSSDKMRNSATETDSASDADRELSMFMNQRRGSRRGGQGGQGRATTRTVRCRGGRGGRRGRGVIDDEVIVIGTASTSPFDNEQTETHDEDTSASLTDNAILVNSGGDDNSSESEQVVKPSSEGGQQIEQFELRDYNAQEENTQSQQTTPEPVELPKRVLKYSGRVKRTARKRGLEPYGKKLAQKESKQKREENVEINTTQGHLTAERETQSLRTPTQELRREEQIEEKNTNQNKKGNGQKLSLKRTKGNPDSRWRGGQKIAVASSVPM